MDNDENLESNYAIYSVFSKDIENEPINTELYREYRFKPKDEVRVSPLTGMTGVKDEIGSLDESNEPYDCTTDALDIARSLTESKDIEQKVVSLIELKDCPEDELELIDIPDPKLDLELIDFGEFSKFEPEMINFSDFF